MHVFHWQMIGVNNFRYIRRPYKCHRLDIRMIQILSTASREPFTTLKTPSGNPDSFKYSAILSAEKGVCSDGFKIKQFPTVMANGIIHNGTIAGKLKGVIPATTPSGSCVFGTGNPAPTADESPLNTLGNDVANSTPFFTTQNTALCIVYGLPLSRAMRCDSSSGFFSMIDFKLNMTSARSRIPLDPQIGESFFALIPHYQDQNNWNQVL
ncbi:MAG: hypothetical protein Ct9H300mP9_0620 [Candidatus Neomarinimicrobiota bacterium]|nr:MAG: hypothetical protein Ct9H300mP9_0620 [Candidatus Neomarinimicrobiota bacterium]